MHSYTVGFICVVVICITHSSVGARIAAINGTRAAKLCLSSLYSPENGQIHELSEKTSGNFVASFRCNPGYRMVGKSRISCTDGKWSVRVPWCKSLCQFVNCKDGQKCVLEEPLYRTKCVCKDILECPFQYKPTCGSDHVTYANKCIMGMTGCLKKKEVTALSEKACPNGIFEDASCSECPRTRICPALYDSEYAFLGKLAGLNETDEGIYLNFHREEIYKGGETREKTITVLKKKNENVCSCVPFLPSGKSYVFGKYGKNQNGLSMPLFDEHTFVEKFYSFKQMNLCWLY